MKCAVGTTKKLREYFDCEPQKNMSVIRFLFFIVFLLLLVSEMKYFRAERTKKTRKHATLTMTSAAVNYCSADLGAKIVESSPSSSNPEGVLSEREESIWSAKAEDVVEKPYIVIQLPPHPAIRFVGWHVWQDYSSNPKVVEIAAGMSPNALTDVVHCTALQGPGIQLWELSTPISSAYSFIRFRTVATFGGASTYMNRVFTFSTRPPEPSNSAVAMTAGMSAHTIGNSRLMNNGGGGIGASSSNSYSYQNMSSSMHGGGAGGGGGGLASTSKNASRSVSGGGGAIGGFGAGLTPPRGGYHQPSGAMMSSVPGPRSMSSAAMSHSVPGFMADPRASISAYEAGSPMHMSEMLRELDDDIRMLHPLPVDGLVAKTTSAVNHAATASSSNVRTGSSSRNVSPTRSGDIAMMSSAGAPAAASSSSFMTNGGNQIDEMKREMADLRSQLIIMSRNGGGGGRSTSPGRSGSISKAAPVAAQFPHDELAALVDSIMEPKLMKWARKLESRILMKVDETLKDLLGQITAAIDARVEQHMRHVIKNHHIEFGEDCKICSHHRRCQHSDFSAHSAAAGRTAERPPAAAAAASSTKSAGGRR